MEINIHIENVYITETAERQITPVTLTVKRQLKKVATPLKEFSFITKENSIKPKTVNNFKSNTGEFNTEHYLAIEDIVKREKALFNKRWMLKKAGKLTNIIDSEITSMLDEIKIIKKKRQ